MRLIIILMMLFCLWICTVPFSHTETISPVPQESPEVTSSSPSGKVQESAPYVSSPWLRNEDNQGTLEPLQTVRKTAEAAVQSLGRTLGQYVQGKYRQYKNSELVAQFEAVLAQHSQALGLVPSEARELAYWVERAYIEDAESGKNELDQVYFHDLPAVVKKVYSEMRLKSTRDGIVETYDLKGRIKSRWEFSGGQPEGPVITYYPDGEIRYIDLYEKGRRVQRKKFDEEGRMLFVQDYDYERKKPDLAESKTEAQDKFRSSPPSLAEKNDSLAVPETPSRGEEELQAPPVLKAEPLAS